MVEPIVEPGGLSPQEVELMRSVEDELWWYQALRAHVINSLPSMLPTFQLLDAGCGTGGMLARIRQHFTQAKLTGIDLSESGLELTRQRETGAELLRASTNRLPFPEAEFDVVLSLDVLAFRGVDEQGAIGEMYRVLRPGGSLLMNVPAFDFLRGSHDAAVDQVRRYTRPQLTALLKRAGFPRARLSYWNMSLLPAIAAVRWASRARAELPDVRSDLAPMWPPLNSLLRGLAQFELAVSRHLALPFGTSLFAVAQK